ncbi:unnamed protein product [Linum trigynum]|uniref:Uncharacterized protein n=1 Tax=Linum trigynum TaxID=586398 RepID=A0AAV2CLT8_9ROSI
MFSSIAQILLVAASLLAVLPLVVPVWVMPWTLLVLILHRPTPHLLRRQVPLHLQVANGDQLLVLGSRTVSMSNITLPDTIYVPKLVPNLVSVGQLTDDGCDVSFNTNGCIVQDQRTGRVIGIGHRQGRVFVLDAYQQQPSGHLEATSSSSDHQSSLLDTDVSGFSVKPLDFFGSDLSLGFIALSVGPSSFC